MIVLPVVILLLILLLWSRNTQTPVTNMATENNEAPSPARINGWLATLIILLVVIGLPMVFCTGMLSGMSAKEPKITYIIHPTGTADDAEKKREMTPRERMIATQLGANWFYDHGNGTAAAWVDGRWCTYVMKDDKLTLLEKPD